MPVPPAVIAALIFGVVGFGIAVVALVFALLEFMDERDETTIADMYVEKRDAIVTVFVEMTTGVTGKGSGFFVSPDGYVVTAGHNLFNDPVPGPPAGNDITDKVPLVWVTVTNWNGTMEHRTVPADIVGIDGAGDLGLLKIPGVTKHNFLEFCDNRLAQPGTPCVVIGDPNGMDHQSCTVGVVRDEMYTLIAGSMPHEQIHIDADTMGGNSGSPILNAEGDVIGILNFGLAGQETFNGGTASSIMRVVIDRMLQDHANGTNLWTSGTHRDYNLKGYLGLQWDPVQNSHIIHHSGASGLDHTVFNHRGVVVQALDANGGLGVYNAAVAPGEQINAHTTDGDWILSIDGHDLGYLDNLIAPGTVTWHKKAGETVTIEWLQHSTQTIKTAVITLAAFPVTEDYPLNFSGYNC